MAGIGKLLMTSTEPGDLTDSNTTSGDDTKPAPAFVTIQSLATFPGAAIAVTIIWVFFDQVLGVNHRAVPVVGAFVIAFLLFLLALKSASSGTEKLFALVLAAINGMYLALSVLGIDVGVGKVGGNQIGGETG
jgi:hypothetical protein